MQIKKWLLVENIQRCVVIASLFWSAIAFGLQDLDLLSVQTRSAPGNKAQILLEFSGLPSDPTGFALSSPAQMIFDFPGVKSKLSKESATQNVSAGVMKEVRFVASGDVTRMIVDVINLVPYTVEIDVNRLIITLDNDVRAETVAPTNGVHTISSLDFRRGDLGEGRVVVEYSGDKVPVDFKDNGNDLIVEFVGATISDSLLRQYDVKDFATNIDQITVARKNNNVILTVATHGDYENVAYQLDDEFIIEVRPLSAEAALAIKAQKFKFSGEKISLNFQDIEVRAVLQLIADFTGINMVISDTVNGGVTLRLDNVPWDQALDFILSSKGLAKRETGNVMLIAPSEEINAREQLSLEAKQQEQTLAPLQSEYIRINYAKASDMVGILKATDNSLLSTRGQISVDDRTNTLLIKDTAENIVKMRDLIEHLDIPVRQVIIETQIVQTTDELNDALGIRMGGAATPQLGKYTLGIAPNMVDAETFAQDKSSKNVTDNNLFFDFIATGVKSTVGLALARLPGGTLLDLELSASESENRSKTVARPKLMTLDQQQASIETGQEIAFSTTSQDGATPTTTFKKAVLKLDVTPQITPNDKVTLALTINNDSLGPEVNGDASINTTTMTTNVLVDDGETIVLGGIFKLNQSKAIKAVPYLSEIPVLGRLFSATSDTLNRTEILIFVTPRIIKSLFSLG